MSYARDLIGKKFGRLFVVSRNYEKQHELFVNRGVQKAFWNCVCDCGNNKVVESSNLTNKQNPTLSCGCYALERRHKQKNTKDIKWFRDKDIVIGTTNAGKHFKVSLIDFEKVKNYCWRIDSRGYVVANSRDGSNSTIKLHRLIMDTKPNDIIDHKDWDKTNNTRDNLRVATKSQNNINVKLKSNNTTGYPGITINQSGNYIVRISYDGKRHYIGTYKAFHDAIIARRNAEIKYHAEWSGENNKHDYEKHIKKKGRNNYATG